MPHHRYSSRYSRFLSKGDSSFSSSAFLSAHQFCRSSCENLHSCPKIFCLHSSKSETVQGREDQGQCDSETLQRLENYLEASSSPLRCSSSLHRVQCHSSTYGSNGATFKEGHQADAPTTPVLASDEVLSSTITDTSPGGHRRRGFSYQQIHKVLGTPAESSVKRKLDADADDGSSDEEISHSAARSLLDRRRQKASSDRKGKKKARIEKSSPVVIEGPDVVRDFQDLVNMVYGEDSSETSLEPDFPASPSPPPIASSSKVPPPAPHRRQPLKSAIKPAPPPLLPGVVEETPFGEILVLYEGGIIPDVFFSEWERQIKVPMDGRTLGIAPEQWEDFQAVMKAAVKVVVALPPREEVRGQDGQDKRQARPETGSEWAPVSGATRILRGEIRLETEVVNLPEVERKIPAASRIRQWIHGTELVGTETQWTITPLEDAPSQEMLHVVEGLPAPGHLRGLPVAAIHGRFLQLAAGAIPLTPALGTNIVIVVSTPDAVRVVLEAGWLSYIGLGCLTGTAVRAAREKSLAKSMTYHLDKDSGKIVPLVRTVDNSGDPSLTFVGFLEAAPLMIKAIRSFFIPHGRSRTGSSIALNSADEYKALFEYIRSREDVQVQWPSYNEYIGTVMRHDLRNRAEGYPCNVGTFDDKLFTNIAWSHVRQDASEAKALSSLIQAKPAPKVASAPSFRPKKTSRIDPSHGSPQSLPLLALWSL
ncbi:hypothetical protein C8J56DRAFT_886406 [Mycena floridula]|nr:hypothetical protein C8J56DRAFT_886406 [Mycena floridula]